MKYLQTEASETALRTYAKELLNNKNDCIMTFNDGRKRYKDSIVLQLIR